ncbi:MAG: VCBS repeat-containing protein [Acidobacteriota bacterium]|nr:VCBS repeat-containing protein [Acidobacteriota bacterium]
MKTYIIFRLSALILFATGPAAAQKDLNFDRGVLETTEELTEALANRLLDLSVATRDANLLDMTAFFAETVVAHAMPVKTLPTKARVKWVEEHDWQMPEKKAAAMKRDALMQSWETFLSRFGSIEDVRFKVKQSEIKDNHAGAKVYFFLVGRRMNGHKEWVRGYFKLGATYRDKTWTIDKLALTSLGSQVASRDVFSEVGIPAGVAADLPPHGAKGNESSYWQGAAAGDVNRDGLIDVFAPGLDGNNFYINQGDGTFKDMAADTWVEFTPHATGALFVDYDNDGDSDIFLATPDNQMLLENRLVPDNLLEFTESSAKSGIGQRRAVGFSPIAGDVNGDGKPDIYVPSYNRYGIVMPNSWYKATNGTPNLLFLNKGGGVFAEVAKAWGVADSRWSYAASFADLDGDGDQDLYVANDYGENGLFINDGRKFTDQAEQRGALDPGNGMGVSFGDFDNDGDLDLHVTNMSSTAGNRILSRLLDNPKSREEVLVKLASGNNLYENDGTGNFKDSQTGQFGAGWAWGGGFIDVDNDGWEDIYTPNGFKSGSSMKDT